MRLHTAFFGLLLLTSSTHADPGWWEARGVISTTPAANLAPANIGQAKHMAAMALAELQGKLPATSHQALQADVALIVDLSLPDPLPPGYHETQRAVLLNGQLKAIAKPFYDHLRTHNAAWLDNAIATGNLVVMEPGSNSLTPSPYPWSVASTDDANRAPATLGQLKAVFSLPLEMLTDISTTLDTDGDGMMDAWEIQYSLNPNDPSDANTDADNDGFSNLQEYQSNSNPTNASAVPGDRDGDSLADDLDAVPDDAEINWTKTPECHYVWIEQATGTSTNGGAPKHVNARGQILFEYSHSHPPIYETYPEETLDNVLWDSTSQAWIPLATSGSGNSGKVIELFGLSDQGYVFGASHTFSDFQPDSPSVNSAGMIWKPSASSPNTYLSPTHFMPNVVNRVSSGVDWRGTVSNHGIANCTTFRSNTTGAWETYNGSSTSLNLTSISGLGNEDRVPGAILDASASLMLVKPYQTGSSWSLKLYDGSQVSNVDGLLPANNLGAYTPATDINITPSLKTNGQRRLWLTAHYYASGVYHYPVRIEKRAGGTGAARWHQPPSMAEGAWKLNARGEAIKSEKIWRNGTYKDLNTITSKSDTVTITHAIDLASNGIILAQAEENGVNKAGLLLPVEAKEVWSNQIADVEANGFPDKTGPKEYPYLFIGATSATTFKVKIKLAAEIPAAVSSQILFRWASEGVFGEFLPETGTSTFFDGTTVQLSSNFNINVGRERFLVWAFDENKNGQIDASESETLIKMPHTKSKKPTIVPCKFIPIAQADYEDSRETLLDWVSSTLVQSTLIDSARHLTAFCNGTVPAYAGSEPTTIKRNETGLTHPVGVAFTPTSNPGVSFKAIISKDHDLSKNLIKSNALRGWLAGEFNSVAEAIRADIIQERVNGNPAALLSYSITAKEKSLAFGIVDPDLLLCLGKVAFENPTIDFDVDMHGFVSKVRVSGLANDLYDFDYEGEELLGYPARKASEVQAGFPSLGVGGKVIKTQIDLGGGNPYSNPDLTPYTFFPY